MRSNQLIQPIVLIHVLVFEIDIEKNLDSYSKFLRLYVTIYICIYSPISSKIQLLTCMATPEFFFVKGLGSEILCSFSPRCSNMTQILWLAPYSLNAAAFVKSSYYGGHSFYVYLTQLSIDSSHKIISNTTNSKNVNRRLTSLSCFL